MRTLKKKNNDKLEMNGLKHLANNQLWFFNLKPSWNLDHFKFKNYFNLKKLEINKADVR